MKHNKEDIYQLMIEKISGYISPEDDLIVEKAIQEDLEIREMWAEVKVKYALKGEDFLNSMDERQAWNNISHKIVRPQKEVKRISFNKPWLTAAAVILLVSLVAVIFYGRHQEKAVPLLIAKKESSNGIALKLADGRVISLKDSGHVSLADADLRMKNGKLDYQSGNSGLEWNTLVVPPKMNYSIVLSDGTEVYLNAVSNLRFPFNFSSTKREVFLEGEAHFKVAKNADKPFIVHAGGTEIQVLGTVFNVNTYNGQVTTSLVEGAVKNTAGAQAVLLKPGQQTVFNENGKFDLQPFDAEVVLSWMQGVYYFDNIPLKSISGILYRWFGVKVVVDNPSIADFSFTGAIEKDKPLAVFIHNLETTSGIKGSLKDNELHLQ